MDEGMRVPGEVGGGEEGGGREGVGRVVGDKVSDGELGHPSSSTSSHFRSVELFSDSSSVLLSVNK